MAREREGAERRSRGLAPFGTVPATTSARMSAQKRTNTTPEMLLRKQLHAKGLRYRVNMPIPGLPRRRADITFTRAKLAVFVDGCFWHRCPTHATDPATRGEWWRQKLDGNVARDRETDEHLRRLGWSVLRFWEHEDMEQAARVVAAAVSRSDR
ncbi:very short patch repair endonuclease [Amycolatopsis thermoflava]|uniref:very short patch repair endonuclease n=1 Tax=Amycolatopsis thermoflava TaxID=84480 RepID=UPI0038102B7E